MNGKIPDRRKLERLAWLLDSSIPIPGTRFSIGLDALSGHLPAITDSYNTNSHFCLSVVELMESLVLGWASDDLALGERGKRWLDEDEHSVRKRIHADLEMDT